MSRRTLAAALAAVVTAAAVAIFVRGRPSPAPPAPAPLPRERAARRDALPPLPPPATARPGPSPRVPEAAPAGALTIESDVPGASVFVDRRYAGEAPVTLHDVAPGPHRVNVSAEGYEGYAESVEVTGERQTVAARLKDVELDLRLAVVHRHAIGSCRGTLSATPTRLRYEAKTAADAFDVPLGGVASLKVDYLGKTLRVALAGGRSYTFAEPSGNADALLVFQQKVEKARSRP